MKLFFILFLLLQIRAFNINNIIFHAKLCKITYNNNTLDICFRGTKNINDIYLNLNIIPRSFIRNDMMFHRGFLYKYLSIREYIINKTHEIISNNNIEDIYISGHSSGGAIANIASLDLYYKYPKMRINTITFGSPRVANEAFINEYNKNIENSIRIVNNNDIIQYLPLPIIYHHIHKPYILTNKNKNVNFNLIKIIKENHGIDTYIRNLRKIN